MKINNTKGVKMPNLELTQDRCHSWEGFYIIWSIPVGSSLEYEWGREAFSKQKNRFLQLLRDVGYADVDFDSLVTSFYGQAGQSVAFHSLPKKDYFTLLLEYYQVNNDEVTLKLVQDYLSKRTDKELYIKAYSVTGCPIIKDAYNALVLKEIDKLESQLESLKTQLL